MYAPHITVTVTPLHLTRSSHFEEEMAITPLFQVNSTLSAFIMMRFASLRDLELCSYCILQPQFPHLLPSKKIKNMQLGCS